MKKWWTSKTIWLNVVTLAGVLAQAMADKQIIDPQIALMIVNGLNIILRLITTQKVGK